MSPLFLVLFPDQPESLHEKVFVERDRVTAMRADQGADAARRHDGRGGSSEFRGEAVDQTVDRACRAVDHARFHAVHRIDGDRVARRLQVNVGEKCGLLGERVLRNDHAGQDRAADVAGFFVHHRDGGRRPHVHDDAGQGIFFFGGDCRGDEVGGNGAGIVDGDVKSCFDARAYHQRVVTRQNSHGAKQREGERGDDARNHCPLESRGGQVAERQYLFDLRGVAEIGLCAVGGDAEDRLCRSLTVYATKGRMRVSAVNGKDHDDFSVKISFLQYL